jgi:hypothetical protein
VSRFKDNRQPVVYKAPNLWAERILASGGAVSWLVDYLVIWWAGWMVIGIPLFIKT